MKRLIVLLLCVGAATSGRADLDRAGMIRLSASVLKVEAVRTQGGISLGTGVVVAPQRVVTNCHVTRDALRISVLRGGLRLPVDSQLSDVAHDLCLLQVPALEANAVALGRADRLEIGQAVTALGYTGGMGLHNSGGEVEALHRFDGGRVIQSSNWFGSGASGGGLFDDTLHLVGVLSFRLPGAARYFAAPSEWLLAMLDARDGYRDVAPDRSPQLAFWQLPSLEQPRFLRAAVLQRDAQWQALESLASEWAAADAADPEPWTLMALALSRMNRDAEAQQALACSRAAQRERPATDNTPCMPAGAAPRSP